MEPKDGIGRLWRKAGESEHVLVQRIPQRDAAFPTVPPLLLLPSHNLASLSSHSTPDVGLPGEVAWYKCDCAGRSSRTAND